MAEIIEISRAALHEQVWEELSRARSHQPFDQKLARLRSLTDKAAGRQGFEWEAPEGVSTKGLTFKVTANTGAANIEAKTLTFDAVTAVNTAGGTLTLELASGGQTPYSLVKAVS